MSEQKYKNWSTVCNIFAMVNNDWTMSEQYVSNELTMCK